MKNRIYWCCSAFFSLVIIFSIAYYMSFRSSVNQDRTNDIQNAKTISSKNENVVKVDAHSSVRISDKTKYVEENYDMADAVYSDKTVKMPKEYVGLNRTELEQKLTDQSRHLSKEEKNKGLLYITLVSFSEHSVTVRKVYDNKAHYKYYMNVKDGYVVVYANDKTTIVDETGIAFNNLHDDQKQEVSQGVYIDTLEELYSILESYSS